MERRGKRIAYDRTRSLDKKVIVKNSAVIPVSVPHLARLDYLRQDYRRRSSSRWLCRHRHRRI